MGQQLWRGTQRYFELRHVISTQAVVAQRTQVFLGVLHQTNENGNR